MFVDGNLSKCEDKVVKMSHNNIFTTKGNNVYREAPGYSIWLEEVYSFFLLEFGKKE